MSDNRERKFKDLFEDQGLLSSVLKTLKKVAYCVSPSYADDAVQQVLVRLLEKAREDGEALERIQSEAYLIRSLRHAIVDLARKDGRAPTVAVESCGEPQDPGLSPHEQMEVAEDRAVAEGDRKEIRRMARQACETLPPRYRAVMEYCIARFLEEGEFPGTRELADAFEISYGAAGPLRCRALGCFREALVEEGIEEIYEVPPPERQLYARN